MSLPSIEDKLFRTINMNEQWLEGPRGEPDLRGDTEPINRSKNNMMRLDLM